MQTIARLVQIINSKSKCLLSHYVINGESDVKSCITVLRPCLIQNLRWELLYWASWFRQQSWEDLIVWFNRWEAAFILAEKDKLKKSLLSIQMARVVFIYHADEKR